MLIMKIILSGFFQESENPKRSGKLVFGPKIVFSFIVSVNHFSDQKLFFHLFYLVVMLIMKISVRIFLKSTGGFEKVR